MKIRSIVSVLLACITFVLFLQCSGDQKGTGEAVTDSVTGQEAEIHEHEQDVTSAEAGKPQFTVDEVFQKQLATLFKSYVSLKEAFVSSDPGNVKKAAEDTEETLKKVDMKLVTGAAHNDWMTYQQSIQSSLDEIKSSDDIEEQRKTFSQLSDALYKSIKAYGLAGTTAYYEYCPMAFDNKGGYWLSDNAQIRNPYFGDKMLTCGQVRETLQ